MEQNAHFVRSREELQKFVNQLASLSRSESSPEEFLRRFLETTVRAIDGRGGTVWFPQGGSFQRVSSTPFTETQYDSNEQQRRGILNALRDAAQHRRPVVVGPSDGESALQAPQPGDITNCTAFPFFYVPITPREPEGVQPAVGVVQVWLSPNLEPTQYKEVVSFLQLAAEQGAAFFRTRRLESSAATTDKLQQVVRFVSELNGQLDSALLAISVVNWVREIAGADRCALFATTPTGKLRVLAVSNVEVVEPKSALVQCQMLLAHDSLEAEQPTLYRKSAPKSEALGDISDYFFHTHANEAMAMPLAGRSGDTVGVLLIESHKDKVIDEPMRKLVVNLAGHAGRALGAAQEMAAIPLVKPLKRLAQARIAIQSDRRKRILMRLGVPVAGLLLLAVCPWRFSVSGDCTVVPTVRARAIAEASGRLVEVLVDEGQHVEAGQRVARLDDAELQQELTVLQQEKLKYQVEADRQEVLGDDGARRSAEIGMMRIVRQIEQVKRHLDQMYLRSPIAGVVLTKDLHSRLGEMLPLGSLFCDVADLSRWEVAIQLRESDVALVDAPLRQGKRLPIRFLLYALPNRSFTASVDNIAAVSQMSYQVPRANVFLLKTDVDAPPSTRDALKTGYSGSARVYLGWRPAIAVATRKFFSYIRTRWLF